MENNLFKSKPCIYTIETGKHEYLTTTSEYRDGYEFGVPKCDNCGWIDTKHIKDEVLKAERARLREKVENLPVIIADTRFNPDDKPVYTDTVAKDDVLQLLTDEAGTEEKGNG